MKILWFFFTILAANAYLCNGNCPRNLCTTCPCGNIQVPVDVNYWCSQHNWNQTCCTCIVGKESTGNANAMNYNTDSSYDVGLWQINSVNWPSCNAGRPPCNLQQNLQCAIKIYGYGGNTWKYWSTAAACNCANSS